MNMARRFLTAAPLLLAMFTAAHNAAAWAEVAGCGKSIASGGGETWMIGCTPASANGGEVLHWNGHAWEKVDGAATSIAVGSDGVVWTTNASGGIYRRTGAAWAQMPGTAHAIASGGGQTYILANAANAAGNHEILKWNGSTGWDATNGTGTSLAVGSDGVPWTVNSAKEIYKRSGAAWARLPGTAHDIASGAGQTWILAAALNAAGNRDILKWNGSTGWDKTDGEVVGLAVGADGSLWGVNVAGQVYKR